ncbi:conserved hypothetical protein [Methylocella tundrae]|uniref:NlpC/P60 domain-containing protein n=1 Tax=Methylocella tundrae TaxID=227605 RepID=A0A8B6M2J6_METTU|nr:conserved hypothetical protein [Methylocella tundrae]VTZ49251.1 conserved hypothetical protein [Methylocella tundrae]
MNTDDCQRARIVAEARRWIGTPYHSCADILGAGVDCGMLLVRVYVDLGLVPPFDPRPYPEDWHLHRSAERYLGFIVKTCKEIAAPRSGDIVVFKYGRCFSHGAIVTEENPITIVHAFQPYGVVFEEEVRRNAQLVEPKRPRRYFSLWKGE